MTNGVLGVIVCLGALLVSSVASAEIVDTLAGFEADTPGWSGSLGASVSATGGNTELVSLSGAGRMQWQNTSERVRVLAAGTHETADGERVAEDLLGHLRHNHRLTGWLRTLAFVQVQNNPFQRLKTRTLFGAGGRFELVATDRWDLALGAAHMLELERLEGASETTTEHRLSSFVALSASPHEGVTIETTAFVQPRWAAFDDVRISADASVRSRLVGRLSLVVSAGYTYDAEPPDDVESKDWSVESGLSLRL